MSDETIELTEVQIVLDGLSSPTDEQFVQAVRDYSDGAVASAAAKLAMAGGGGGSLPAWWTVDSTPGGEQVDFAGKLIAHVADTDTISDFVDDFSGGGLTIRRYGLLLCAETGTQSGAALSITSGVPIEDGENLLQIDNVEDTVLTVSPAGAVTISPSVNTDVPITTTANVGGAVFDVTGAPVLDPATCTPEDIANALIALGLAVTP